MTMLKMKPVAPKDLLVKVLATVFLNPMDREQQGKKIFIQKFLGCGCPDEIVAQAGVRFFLRPLGSWLKRNIASSEATAAATPLEQQVHVLMKLPKRLAWPRLRSGRPAPPTAWRRHLLERDGIKTGHVEKLMSLRRMSNATIDAVIDVPGRALFFLVVEDRPRLSKSNLAVQYHSGQLLYQLMGYNRCRLFTITQNSGSKIIPQVDTALSWQGLYEAFDQVRHGYPFAHIILKYFETDQ
jgi:hypothetical protein